MKKLIIILSSIVTLLFLIAAVVPLFISWDKYEPMVKKLVKEKTGYDFVLQDGGSFSILPLPGIELRGLKISNPKYAEHPLLNLGSLNVTINPFSLLFGSVSVSSITIADGKIIYLTDEIGSTNLMNAGDVANKLDANSAAETTEQIAPATDEKNVLASFGIDHASLKNVEIISQDLRTNTRQSVLIEDAYLSFDSLEGPFETDMNIAYQDYNLAIEGNVGRIIEGQPSKISLKLNEKRSNINVTMVGDVNLSESASFSGQVSAKQGSKSFAGNIVASQTRVLFSDALLSVDQAKADVNFELSGLGSEIVVVSSTIAFKDRIDINALMKEAEAAGFKALENNDSSAAQNGNETKTAVNTLLPEKITLPGNLKANVNVSAPGISYNGEQTGNVVLAGVFADGVMKADFNAFSLPKQSSLSASGSLAFGRQKVLDDAGQILYSEPNLDVNIKGASQNLRDLLVWLGFPKEQINYNIPNVVSADIGASITPTELRLNAKEMNVGPTSIDGSVIYQLPKDGHKLPLIKANLVAGQLILPDLLASSNDQAAGVSTSSGNTSGSASSDIEAHQNQIQKMVRSIAYNLDLDIRANDITMGDKSFKNFGLRLLKNGDVIDLRNFQIGEHMGTALSISAKADFGNDASKDMSINAKIQSKNIDPLLTAYQISLPEQLPSPLGSVSAALAANGSVSNANLNMDASIYGFSMSVIAQGVDVLSSSLPKTIAVKAMHPNTEKALQFIAPDYRADSNLMNGAFAFSANVSQNNNTFSVSDLILKLGPSTIKGQSNIDLSNTLPYIRGDISADNLPVKVLMGGTETRTDTASTSSSGGQAQLESGETPWSRDAIDTSVLRSVNADISVKAQKFAYGATVLHDTTLKASLSNGVLKLSELYGDLREGKLTGNLNVSATQANQPIIIDGNIALKDSTISSATNALMGHSTKKLEGGMEFDMGFKAQGVSSAALVNALNGQGRVQLIDPVIQGLDIKGIYNTVRNIDSVQGALGALLQNKLNEGSTQLNSVDKQFQIVNGVVPIDNWDTKADHAVLVSNGKIDLPNWKIDIMNQIQIEKVKDIPAFGMRIYGPLDSPQTVMTRQSLEDFMQSRLGDKARDFITDKLISEDIQNKVKDKIGVGIGDLLPLGRREETQNDDSSSEQPANDNNGDPEPTIEERLIRGIFDKL